jgi:hypothetical protein
MCAVPPGGPRNHRHGIGGVTLPGALARRAWAWRSMFWKTSDAPRHGSTSCNLPAAVDGSDDRRYATGQKPVIVDSGGHSESYDGVNVKPSSIQPVTPPIIIFTGKPSRARRNAALLAPLQCGPAQ